MPLNDRFNAPISPHGRPAHLARAVSTTSTTSAPKTKRWAYTVKTPAAQPKAKAPASAPLVAPGALRPGSQHAAARPSRWGDKLRWPGGRVTELAGAAL